MKKCRSIMTVDMGYKPRTRKLKAMDQKDTQEVLVVQVKMRESKYINNKSNYKTTLANTAPPNTIIGLKSGAEQRVGDRIPNKIEMTIVTAERFTISGPELGLDRASDTIPMTTKMTTATASVTAMATEQANMPIVTQSPTRKATTTSCFPTPVKQVSLRLGT
jgi:hypothetical protein